MQSFTTLKEDVIKAKEEAQDNHKYLSTLRKYFEKLHYKTEISEIKEAYVPIMHLIMLIQSHSMYYKSNTNLVILIRQICNEIITQSCRYLNGPELISKIIENDIHQAYRMLIEIRETSKHFKMV